MEPARILTVCTGNIRRSPAMELLLRHGTPTHHGLPTSLKVSSAGVEAVVDHGMEPLIRSALTSLDVPERTFSPRQLTPAMIEKADLVITATRAQRSAVVRMVPSAVRRTFTLVEIARLGARLGRTHLGGIDTLPTARLRELVRQAPLARGAALTRKPADLDVVDPRRLTARSADRLITEVRAPVETLLYLLEPRVVVDPKTAKRGLAVSWHKRDDIASGAPQDPDDVESSAG